MKHIDLFDEFLKDTVNLNPTRVKTLNDSIDPIKDAVRGSDWKPHISGWMVQGSWAHQTIIKPVDQGEFDADLIVFVSPVDGWLAKDYVDKLLAAFKATGTYRDMVKGWSHCVTITYANDKKIDVAPCIVDRGGLTRTEVCNCDTNEFERSEPRQYTNWLIEKNNVTGNNTFRKVTRLIKYLRDIKTRFTCSSVLLTTILGYRISAADKDSAAFADTPTALKTIFGRMDDWLQLNPQKPLVPNPFFASEDFASAWTDDQYTNFRDRIHTYRDWIDDAFNEQDRSESIAKWRRVFGDDFASDVALSEAKNAGNKAVALAKQTLVEASFFEGDLVSMLKRFGARVIPKAFNKQPHMEAPRWKRVATNQTITVNVRADLHANSLGTQPIGRIEPLHPLEKDYWLHFKAVTNTGLPFDSHDYKVMWRVTNTDASAAEKKALRGKFEKPEADNSRWESLAYRGVHLVEAFLVRNRDQRLVGQSEPFHVLIE